MKHRTWNALLVGFVIVALGSLIWPGYAWLGARIDPMVFGVPFSLIWVVGWILATFGFIALYDYSTQEPDA